MYEGNVGASNAESVTEGRDEGTDIGTVAHGPVHGTVAHFPVFEGNVPQFEVPTGGDEHNI